MLQFKGLDGRPLTLLAAAKGTPADIRAALAKAIEEAKAQADQTEPKEKGGLQ